MLDINCGMSKYHHIVQFRSNIFCPIRYRGAISHLAVAWRAASIVLRIGHSEACWQMEQMFERTWTIC